MALTVGTDSYGTANGANVYFQSGVKAARWTAIGAQTQEPALREAWRYIDRVLWAGDKTDPGQVTQWPRANIPDVDSATVPGAIVEMQYELALLIGEDPTILDSIGDTTRNNTKRLVAEGVEIEYFQPSEGSALPNWVFSGVRHLLAGSSGGFTVSSGMASLGDSSASDGFSSSDFSHV